MNNHSLLKTLGILAPFIIAILIFSFRIESRLTRIETDMGWIKQSYQQCQQTLEDLTH
jgi:hypothetical protein